MTSTEEDVEKQNPMHRWWEYEMGELLWQIV
jgi:hypothetical protein